MKIVLTKKEEEAISKVADISSMCGDIFCSGCPLNIKDDERCLVLICKDVIDKNRKVVEEIE